MKNYLLTDHQVLTYYLQTLNNAEVQQIKHFDQWVKHDYSPYFKKFLDEQRENTHDQHTALKALENVMGIYLTGETCEPVQGLLREIEKINQFSGKNAELTEPLFAQLLQCIKHYELVTYQAALVLARNMEEIRVVSTLTEILAEEEQAYLQLQNLVVTRRQNEKETANAEAAQ